ncbi:MAG: cobyric acid synthase [Dehalococcoidia bacterium]|nr:cobyric acid synthase [Dehalococcoidia bacterium]
MTARTLMVQGAASSAGKSVLVAALCRILRQDGYRVAPFKSQNMALNSFVTKDGGEIGRAQAVQAEAAGIQPTVDMNPVLLKPQADATSQVVVLGVARSVTDAAEYYRDNHKLLPVISKSLAKLRKEYDVVVIEGAGSPAEVNLMEREIANMRIAELARAPVILIADIDKGGVFASVVGTLQLLPPKHRNRIKGLVINKFRGDISLLQPGIDFLEKRCRRPVLGVIPYMRNLAVAQEDSVFLDERRAHFREGCPDVCIIRLPHISNFDDFDPLEAHCNVRYAGSVEKLGDPDLIILPGTKGTISDLQFLHLSGLAKKIIQKAKSGTPVFGMCGGYQMLGRKVTDPVKAESDTAEAEGLGLLEFDTVFEADKITSQVRGKVDTDRGLLAGMRGVEVTGYEIHMGRSRGQKSGFVFKIIESGSTPSVYTEGGMDRTGLVFGTYMHGVFNNAEFTRRLVNNLCSLRNLPPPAGRAPDREKAYDDLAATVRRSIDMEKLYEIIFKKRNKS